MASIELDDVYDGDTLARIERGPRDPGPPRAGRARTTSAAMAVVTGIALGLQEVLQPPRRAEIEVVDPWEAGPGPQARVRFHWHPSPPASVAEVRW